LGRKNMNNYPYVLAKFYLENSTRNPFFSSFKPALKMTNFSLTHTLHNLPALLLYYAPARFCPVTPHCPINFLVTHYHRSSPVLAPTTQHATQPLLTHKHPPNHLQTSTKLRWTQNPNLLHMLVLIMGFSWMIKMMIVYQF